MHVAKRLGGACAGMLVLAVGATGLRGQTLEGFSQSTVVSGLASPTALAFLPDGRLLVTEHDGTLLLADLLLEGGPITLAQIPTAFCAESDYETGLLGVAVHPDFASNGFIFLYRSVESVFGPCEYQDTGRVQQVVRVTMTDGTEGLPGPSVDLDSLVVLLTGIRADLPYHCGGGLRISPDGKLFVSTGETGLGDFEGEGPGESTNPYAQDLAALEGKLLRLNLDGSIPADNPFVGRGGGVREEIFALGFRNPWRFGIDPQSGLPWVGDVGEEDVEEIDLVLPGSNHGWPRCEGKLPAGCKEKGDAFPVFSYPHDGPTSLGSSVTGGAFAPGPFHYYGGHYAFGDFTGGGLHLAALNAKRTGFKGAPLLLTSEAAGPVDMAFGPDAALYYLSFFTGEVRRLAPPPSGGDQPLSGMSLLLKDGPAKLLKLLSKDAVVLGGGSDNPVFAGGTLRLLAFGGAEGGLPIFDDTYALPAAGWKLLGKAPDGVKGFSYRDPKLLSGPISSVVVQAGKLIKILGKQDGLGHDLTTEPSEVLVVLTLGTRTWCFRFGGETVFKPESSFSAKLADAPESCP